jgi:spore coat polysaccharide biosynthesis protein SpsF (cytidylyltransferase family)
MRTVAVIQARMGSTRVPGKILDDIAGRPLVFWTIDAVGAVPAVDELVVATTDQPADDPFAERLTAAGVRVHRGSTHDVLRRVVDAVRPLGPDVVLRQTGDNPFPDPDVMEAQIERLVEGGFDYVGINGLPLGIGGEAVRMAALETADREATEPAEREHVLPYLYARPERFRIGALADPPSWEHPRYTVDTDEDMAFARAIAARLPAGRAARLADLEAIVGAEPDIAAMNRDVEQRHHRVAELTSPARERT